jgi:Co/Zn/Cd efflux system component
MDSEPNSKLGMEATGEEPEVDRQKIQPFGLSGVGVITGHSVGLILIAGVILIAVEAIPAARWFVAAAVAIGILIGISLWLCHRRKNYG